MTELSVLVVQRIFLFIYSFIFSVSKSYWEDPSSCRELGGCCYDTVVQCSATVEANDQASVTSSYAQRIQLQKRGVERKTEEDWSAVYPSSVHNMAFTTLKQRPQLHRLSGVSTGEIHLVLGRGINVCQDGTFLRCSCFEVIHTKRYSSPMLL